MSGDERTGKPAGIAELLFGADENGRDTQCAHCRAPVHLHGGVVDMARSWNRRQVRLEREDKPYERPIQYNELALCDGCYRRWQRKLEEDSRLNHETARFYLQQLREESYTAESLLWLRMHGYGADVDRFLEREMKTPEQRKAGK